MAVKYIIKISTKFDNILYLEDKWVRTSGTSFDKRGWIWPDGTVDDGPALDPEEKKNCLSWEVNTGQLKATHCGSHLNYVCVSDRKWQGILLRL